MRYTNCNLYPAPVSGTTTSEPVDSTSFQSFSILSVSTDTLTGSIQVQVSNDPAAHPGTPPANWSNYGAPIAVTAASVLNSVFTSTPFMWVRVVFTASGGAGTVQARLKSMGW